MISLNEHNNWISIRECKKRNLFLHITIDCVGRVRDLSYANLGDK